MSHVFPMTHIVSPVQHSFVSEMSQYLSRLGFLPDPVADTHSHHRSRPILAHESEEATYDSDDLHVRSIVEWAGKQQPPPPRSSAHRYADLRIALKCTAARGGVQGCGQG